MSEPIRVAIVGLGFGAEFIPIYQGHPGAELYAICQRSADKLNAIGDAFEIAQRTTDFAELLRDESIDAIHINTPIHLHASQTIAALEAGKHVGCTVPMATSVDECRRICAAQRANRKHYMMFETTVYSREFLYVKELRDSGRLGRIQFLRAAHQQEMAGWPGYWEGLPPMHYATHCVGPVLAMAQAETEYVSCFGSGRIDEPLIAKYGSPFAIETCHMKLRDSDLSAEITRSLFNTSREYVESFDVYGSKMTFEWQQLEADQPVVFRGEQGARTDIPDYAGLLPEGIAAYTTRGVYDDDENRHLSFTQGSGHGGSHPHLAHEFISALQEDRAPFPDAPSSANWTSTGILAHESAMQGGRIIPVPDFREG